MSNTFVVLMGLCTVFVGLICIIIVCSIMSALVRAFEKNKPVKPLAVPASPASGEIEDRANVVVAISAAIAEELGEDASAIRILSLKKI